MFHILYVLVGNKWDGLGEFALLEYVPFFFLYLPLWWFPFISLSLPPLYLSALQTVNSQGVGVRHTYIKPGMLHNC